MNQNQKVEPVNRREACGLSFFFFFLYVGNKYIQPKHRREQTKCEGLRNPTLRPKKKKKIRE